MSISISHAGYHFCRNNTWKTHIPEGMGDLEWLNQGDLSEITVEDAKHQSGAMANLLYALLSLKGNGSQEGTLVHKQASGFQQLSTPA